MTQSIHNLASDASLKIQEANGAGTSAQTDRLFYPLIIPAYRFTTYGEGLVRKGREYWDWLGEEGQKGEMKYMDGPVAFITVAHLYSSLTLRDVVYHPYPYVTRPFVIQSPFEPDSKNMFSQFIHNFPCPSFEILVAHGPFSASWQEADGSERKICTALSWKNDKGYNRTSYDFKYGGQKIEPMTRGRGVMLFHSMMTDGSLPPLNGEPEDRLIKTRWVICFFSINSLDRDGAHIWMQKHELYNSVTGKKHPYARKMLGPIWEKLLNQTENIFNQEFPEMPFSHQFFSSSFS